MKKVLLLIAIVIIGGASARIINQKNQEVPTSTGTLEVTQTSLANPASTNCIEKGGTLEMRQNKQGEYGVCLFEDNRQCEEWALLRGDCPDPTNPNPNAGNVEVQ